MLFSENNHRQVGVMKRCSHLRFIFQSQHILNYFILATSEQFGHDSKQRHGVLLINLWCLRNKAFPQSISCILCQHRTKRKLHHGNGNALKLETPSLNCVFCCNMMTRTS